MHAPSSLSFFFVSLLALAPEVSSSPCNPKPQEKAVYFITNEEVNAVAALPIGPDGKLSKGTVTETGGAGSFGLNSTLLPATPDALISQSAITVSGKHVFAVNAGSNSLSVLSISHSDPTKLKLLGEPAAVPGEFVNTVAVSAKNGLACVATTGSVAGVSCAPFSKKKGLGKFDALRPFELEQSTPPVGPANTVSQVLFNEDESVLYAIVKGNPAVGRAGFVSSFPVSEGGVSQDGTRSSASGTDILFGSQVIPGTNNLLVTDPGFGSAIISIDPATHEATTIGLGEVEGQSATCWSTISPDTGRAFITDFGVNRLIEVSVEDASIISITDLSETGALGLTDARAVGDFVYALAAGNGTVEAAVTVVDVSGEGSLLQHFGVGDIAGTRAQGLAVLV
ncbi:uncharacterized protein DNG_04405 [Cephalotrichum gorgonifer]|uniref:3-carboxymuconate cyclase n=1 Tax=Cephalotrichum gorgonifer TaxID=2041049 RepID=A0AAE8MWC7_9PEZI|nr:uncharacterized protein DNG_04405 [Cephalotrichum gorgonifer]